MISKVCLNFFFPTRVGDEVEAALRRLMPGLDWGVEEHLMRHSDGWPEAVALVKRSCWCDEEEDGKCECSLPLCVKLARFPGALAGGEGLMVPTRVGLLRALARELECRVACPAGGLGRAREEDSEFRLPGEDSSLLCQGGRVFWMGRSAQFIVRGDRSEQGWQPLDGLPEVALDRRGRPVAFERVKAELAAWVESPGLPEVEREPREIPFKSPPEVPPEGDGEDDEYDIFGSPSIEDLPDDTQEYFKRLEQWERGVETTASKQVIAGGVSLPAPDTLDDEQVTAKLWEVIRGLRAVNTHLYNTDHLSDRELYEYLWEEGLNEPGIDLAGLTGATCVHDLLGSGSEESVRVGHIYYDDAETRAGWFADWPDEPIPAHVDPPYDRDRKLQSGEY